jgi:hypothetical protein
MKHFVKPRPVVQPAVRMSAAAVVGVPESMPVVVSSVIPAGSAPEATVNVAAGLPVAVKR